ncbi:MAG: hypothetical protein K8U03_01550 [Planctomycetia bacterium]|nr:hypothetical protein [Planctomycetia bacterium]
MPIVSSEHRLLSGFAAPRTVRGCALGRRFFARCFWLSCVILSCALGVANPGSVRAESEISFPEVEARQPILFGGDEATCWTKGLFEVWVLRGRCYVQQGPMATEAQEAVLWVKRTKNDDREETSIIAYLEGDVRIVDSRNTTGYEVRDRAWLGEFASNAPLQVRTPQPKPAPDVLPQVFVNAQARRDLLLQPIRQAQFTSTQNPYAAPIVSNVPPVGAPPVATAQSAPAAVVAQALPYGQSGTTTTPSYTSQPNNVAQPTINAQPGLVVQPGVVAQPNIGIAATPAPPPGRRLRAFSRSSVKVQVKWIPNPNNPQEWVGVISPGVNLIIDGLAGSGQLDISTDRMVVWTTGTNEPDLSGERADGTDRPLQLYLEGNVVFREGTRVIFADRMFYDVNNHVGTILNAEILTPGRTPDSMARLKADAIRQLGENRFVANNVKMTTSRMSNPRYRLQTSELFFEDNQRPVVDPLTGQPAINPVTGEEIVEHDRLASSTNNTVFIGPVPVFYWPRFSSDLESSNFFVRNIRFTTDRIFGQTIKTDLDMFQILGIKNKPSGHDWILSLDYLSSRGPAGGTTYLYAGQDFLGTPGRYRGFFDAWAINDTGFDNLGSDRSHLQPEHEFRHRILERHRQQLPDGFQLTGEFGWISDRNFLEQYYELEWDTFKDQNTGVELKRIVDNQSYALSADFRLNMFFTQTNQLPRFDHFLLGQNLLGDSLTWYEHSSAEYAQLRIASYPRDPADLAKFQLMPWEVTSSGERLVTAQEIDLPFSLGLGKVVPYALGQAGDWGQVIDGNGTQRLYGQMGIRAALPFWSVNPEIKSELLNINGIAHKVTLDVDASVAGANRDLSNFPLYDNLDDDSQEAFRRRFADNTFGGTTPIRFDERYYALRSGMASNVTAASAEIADDMAAVRMGLRQRWQTKRGPMNKQRIVDWITLDTEAVYFPRADRDNFGQNFGLAKYDFRWYLGERLSILSDGGFDFFNQGQSTISAGVMLTRPTNGNIYFGYRSLDGPFQAQVLMASASYRLSPKWLGNASLSYNFTQNGTVGNSFSLLRVGESFLVGFNFAYDAYKNNVMGTLVIEPRFLSGLTRSAMQGASLPPVGAYGLE